MHMSFHYFYCFLGSNAMTDDVAAIATRISRVGEIIQNKVNAEVKNNLLAQELLMRAYEVQALGEILKKVVK